MNRITAGPITLHLDADEEPYDEHPKVGVVALASLRVNTGTDACPHVHEIPLRSGGVWDIEDENLVADYPIPAGSWVIDAYGNDQIRELQALIDTLTKAGGAK